MGGSEGSPSPSSVSTGGSRLGAARARVDGGMREGWSRAGASDVFYEASAAGGRCAEGVPNDERMIKLRGLRALRVRACLDHCSHVWLQGDP